MKKWLIKMILKLTTIKIIEDIYSKYWMLKKFHDLKKLKFEASIKLNVQLIKVIPIWWSIKIMKAFFKENF